VNELALFAGAGGGILGGKLLGWRCVCAVEWDAYAARVLVARQNDGCLEPFPIWDDVRTFDGRAWRGRVDVVSGGFPCQDISCAGKGAGIDGERSGMWVEMARVIGEVGPRFVLVENSPMLTVRGLGRVLGDLASVGYDAIWGVLGADDAGAPHRRKRIWILGWRRGMADCEEQRRRERWTWRFDPSCAGESKQPLQALADAEGIGGGAGLCEAGAERDGDFSGDSGGDLSDANGAGCEQQRRAFADGAEYAAAECGGWWRAEPEMGRVADGVAARVDQLRCLGNGQVPAVVRLAWRTLGRLRGGLNDRSDRSDDDFRGGLKPEQRTTNNKPTKNEQ